MLSFLPLLHWKGCFDASRTDAASCGSTSTQEEQRADEGGERCDDPKEEDRKRPEKSDDHGGELSC